MVRVPVLLLLTLCRTRIKAEPQCLVTIPIRAQQCHQQRVASIHWRYVNTLRRFCFQECSSLITVSTCPLFRSQPYAFSIDGSSGELLAAGATETETQCWMFDIRWITLFVFFHDKSMSCIAGLCNVRYPEQCLCV